mmetsp:Transcript_12049/g.48492  ORF Transcript_12049/g.48492 Transcript_12049/m.48492 type:complete len:305 (-) Transcript_12049:139-1053(-)
MMPKTQDPSVVVVRKEPVINYVWSSRFVVLREESPVDGLDEDAAPLESRRAVRLDLADEVGVPVEAAISREERVQVGRVKVVAPRAVLLDVEVIVQLAALAEAELRLIVSPVIAHDDASRAGAQRVGDLRDDARHRRRLERRQHEETRHAVDLLRRRRRRRGEERVANDVRDARLDDDLLANGSSSSSIFFVVLHDSLRRRRVAALVRRVARPPTEPHLEQLDRSGREVEARDDAQHGTQRPRELRDAVPDAAPELQDVAASGRMRRNHGRAHVVLRFCVFKLPAERGAQRGAELGVDARSVGP